MCSICSRVSVFFFLRRIIHTSNLQLALHLGLSQVVDGAARVPASVEQARFTDVQSQHALVVLHQEFRVFTDDHVVLHPDDLWLRFNKKQEFKLL